MMIVFLVVMFSPMWFDREPRIISVEDSAEKACIKALTEDYWKGFAFKASIGRNGRILWTKPLACKFHAEAK